jgi:hypothetical protein
MGQKLVRGMAMGISGVVNKVLPMLFVGVVAMQPAWSAQDAAGLSESTDSVSEHKIEKNDMEDEAVAQALVQESALEGEGMLAWETGSKNIGHVARATFTSAVQEREPADSIMSLSTDQVQIYYFTELRNLEGQTVVHRWEYDGEVMANIEIAVGGPRWRAWSSKRLMRGWEGEWRVRVLNETDEVLAEDSFIYMAPAYAGEEVR